MLEGLGGECGGNRGVFRRAEQGNSRGFVGYLEIQREKHDIALSYRNSAVREEPFFSFIFLFFKEGGL